MISLNDYLYNGDTVLKIIQKYSNDLKEASLESGNKLDMLHSNFLLRMEELLVHNDFLHHSPTESESCTSTWLKSILF